MIKTIIPLATVFHVMRIGWILHAYTSLLTFMSGSPMSLHAGLKVTTGVWVRIGTRWMEMESELELSKAVSIDRFQ